MSFNSTLAIESEFGRQHIVDVLLEERAVNLRNHPMVWKVVKKYAKLLLGYKRAVQMADAIKPMSGRDVFDYMSATLQLKINVRGLENVPKTGGIILTPNHPAGIADGIAVFDALKSVRDDMIFFANRDCIRASKGLADCVIPVEWREEHRSRSRSRETSEALIRAFRDQRLVVIFPSGRLARPTPLGLKERPWLPTAVSLAQKYSTPIVPMFIKGHNTFLYYMMWYINNEIKDMMLFRELLNKQGQKYQFILGEPLLPEGDVREETDKLREFVVTQLRKGISRPQ